MVGIVPEVFYAGTIPEIAIGFGLRRFFENNEGTNPREDKRKTQELYRSMVEFMFTMEVSCHSKSQHLKAG